ncbi:hypothetical protein GCM10011575_43550 [Microlunatus endophyticus]|uniref:Hydrolase of the HAD superfamily n=1 Tax=Microlunatus endophyticus TaxID=1716077 RepID=A0A917SG84_9ACTN|nr:HAD-IA family hydrolase [Microlunatus endophyticus]GGL80567.1 hypothetical protein GCM10011575_43550 [Microlunatus endophyticus]
MQSEGSANRVVFWDFDGTLARRRGMWSGALVDALALLGPTTVTAEDLKPGLADGFPWHRPDEVVEVTDATGWWQRLAPVLVRAYRAAGVPAKSAHAAAARVATQFYRADAWELIDGATAALGLTRENGYRNVILSNHGPELAELVAALGLDRWIDLVITSALVGAEKPNPRIFRHALRVSDAGSDCWMVGDNPAADVQGARAVGIRAILADGAYADARGVTVVEAAHQIVGRSGSSSGPGHVRMRDGIADA